MGSQDGFQWGCAQQIVIAYLNAAKSIQNFLVVQNKSSKIWNYLFISTLTLFKVI